MTSSFSVSGITSLDTTTLVTQLMTLAAAPQDQLKAKLSTVQHTEADYKAVVGSLNSTLAALQAIGAPVPVGVTPPPSAWTSPTATSSVASVVAGAGPDAANGTALTFDVTALARAQVTTIAASGGTVLSDPTAGLSLSIGGASAVTVYPTDGSAAAVAAAVNKAGLGVRASVVATDNGPLLQLSAASTGLRGAFTVANPGNLTATPMQAVAAQDAKITVGDPLAGGYTVSSATNTFTGVAPGLTFTVSAPATGVTVSVATDPAAVAKSVGAAVDALNSTLSGLKTLTAKGGDLEGDSSVTRIGQNLLAAVTSGNAGKSFAAYGITLTQTGTLHFDATAFTNAYNADPAAAQAAIGTVLAPRLATVATAVADPNTGSLTQAIASKDTAAGRLTTEIADWGDRLARQKTALQNKYAAMQSALSKLESQKSYISNVFDSMNSSQKSSSS